MKQRVATAERDAGIGATRKQVVDSGPSLSAWLGSAMRMAQDVSTATRCTA